MLRAGDQQSTVTFMGMTLAIWKLGALWAMLHFVFVVSLLRGWVRMSTGIPGTTSSGVTISCLFLCYASVQMSAHTTRVLSRKGEHKATLQAYAA